MEKCKVCDGEDVLTSLVDAIILGIGVGTMCKPCAEEQRERYRREDEANADLPEEERICHSCHTKGKDTQGKYPSFFVQPWYQHADCVDWDDVRKYGR